MMSAACCNHVLCQVWPLDMLCAIVSVDNSMVIVNLSCQQTAEWMHMDSLCAMRVQGWSRFQGNQGEQARLRMLSCMI